jgi:hypothetical protein
MMICATKCLNTLTDTNASACSDRRTAMARAVSLSISLRHRGGRRLIQLGMSRAMVGVSVVYATCLHGR